MLSDDVEIITEELCDAYEELGFLKSQELMKKKEVWTSDPTASIQARDRTASYAAAEITAEIYKIEARIHVLNLQRTYAQWVIDGRAQR